MFYKQSYKIYLTPESVLVVRLIPSCYRDESGSGVKFFIEIPINRDGQKTARSYFFMFVNPKFSGRKSPKFCNVFTNDPEREHGKTDGLPYLTARISNDNDVPQKTLVAIDIFDIPPDAKGALKDVPDYITGVSLMPEDAVKLIRWLNTLLKELFNDENYVD